MMLLPSIMTFLTLFFSSVSQPPLQPPSFLPPLVWHFPTMGLSAAAATCAGHMVGPYHLQMQVFNLYFSSFFIL